MPTPLPDGLPPVTAFELDLLPPVLRRRVEDVTERMQCPADFAAVAMMVMLASVVGRRCGITPKLRDDWLVVPNLWGMVIGRPGIMKSPALQEVMKPLRALEHRALARHDEAMREHHAQQLLAEQAERVMKDAIRSALKKGQRATAAEFAEEALKPGGDEPVARRYVVNEPTVEKLGELLNENPSGLLLYRDELTGWFRSLERQGREADRAFYLECWNGDGAFTYDRIGRGTLHIAGACLSMLGTIQPGPVNDLVRGLRGSGDDGLLQRFQLAVWPDAGRDWRNVDRQPDQDARSKVQSLIEQLDAMTAEQLGADPGAGGIPTLRFAPASQGLFDRWRESLELRLRSGKEHPMLEAHLAKYRSLVPSLALLLHLGDTHDGPVELLALERALAWAEYLETHARRLYAPAISPDIDAARALAARVQAGEIGQGFKVRDVYKAGWSGLATKEDAIAAVSVLEDFEWLRGEEQRSPDGGRPTTVYRINPHALPPEEP